MDYYNYNDYDVYDIDRSVMVCIVEIISLYNASVTGWTVKKIGVHKYKLSKNITNDNFQLKNFLNNVFKLEYV